MKIKMLRKVAALKLWANTERGERIIVRVLTTLTGLLILDVVLLLIGELL